MALGSHGTILKMEGTVIAQLADISGPTPTRAMHDAPTQTIEWVEKVAGMINAGSITANVNFVPSLHGVVLTALEDGLERAFILEFPDASGWSFNGVVTECPVDAPVDGVLTAALSVEVSGAIAF